MARLKRYVLALGQSVGYVHPHPERTAYRAGAGVFADNTYQVWPNRSSMARSVRMQQERERRTGDWTPLVKLTDGEGY